MPHHWESCRAVRLIEGRGPVRCWFPPSPGRTLCPSHHPNPDADAGETHLRATVAALLKQTHPKAELCDFSRSPGSPHYELRVGMPGVVAKWVIVPEGIIQRAPDDIAARRTLRNLLATIILVQLGQRASDLSRELLAESG